MARDIENEVLTAYRILQRDLPRLRWIQDYVLGKQAQPYMPTQANDEYRLLADRCVTNWLPLIVDASAQSLFVDNFRRDGEEAEFDQDSKRAEVTSPEWQHWQGSRMDVKQASIFRAALEYGHSFTVTAKDKKGNIRTRGVSPLRAVALFENPMSDTEPTSGFEVVSWPVGEEPGKALYHTETDTYDVTFKQGASKRSDITVSAPRPHGAKSCPMTRFAVHVDLEGNTTGLVEPLIPLQDRVNQTVFDLLIAQTYTSFSVRTVAGMVPPPKMQRNEEGQLVPVLDADGNQVHEDVQLNPTRILYAEDNDTKFGSLPGGNLDGLIEAVELAIRQLSAVAQVPPHYMLGKIANVNADGLRAASDALRRKNGEIATSFGESVERIFRVFAELNGEDVPAGDFGETIWRDLGNSNIAQHADALGKFAEMLDIPKRGLWPLVPGVTRSQLNSWEALRREDNRAMADMMEALPDEVLAMLNSGSTEEVVYSTGGGDGYTDE